MGDASQIWEDATKISFLIVSQDITSGNYQQGKEAARVT